VAKRICTPASGVILFDTDSVESVDEVALRERAAASDPEALATVYERYAGKIYSYVYHRTGDPSLAEDLTADVFVRMMEAMRGQRGWTTSLQGWLYRIAHNLIVDHFRRQAMRDGPELDERWMAPDDSATSLDAMLTQQQLRRAMRFLTEEQQQVIALKFMQDLTNTEVADILGKTEGAVKALQHRGLAALRRILAGLPLEPDESDVPLD
jgi:RNA polymerase sigma-70 factor (ECF subfamily)